MPRLFPSVQRQNSTERPKGLMAELGDVVEELDALDEEKGGYE